MIGMKSPRTPAVASPRRDAEPPKCRVIPSRIAAVPRPLKIRLDFCTIYSIIHIRQIANPGSRSMARLDPSFLRSSSSEPFTFSALGTLPTRGSLSRPVMKPFSTHCAISPTPILGSKTAKSTNQRALYYGILGTLDALRIPKCTVQFISDPFAARFHAVVPSPATLINPGFHGLFRKSRMNPK